MQRVAILGNGGAGKSELAMRLSARTGVPVVYLDRIFWRAGWTPAPRDEALRELEAAVAGERWILDGNFLDVADSRFERVDTLVYLDLPRRTCLRRILWRAVRDRRRRRPDLPDGSREGFDTEFTRWVWRYPHDNRPRVLELLATVDGVDVHHLRSRADVERFLREQV